MLIFWLVPGVLNVVDDVLTHAETEKEHDKQQLQTLQRFYDAGITLDKKGEYKVQKLLFNGHVISSEGASINKKSSSFSSTPAPY